MFWGLPGNQVAMIGGRFGYLFFFVFVLGGGGRESPRRQERGGRFFIENPRRAWSEGGEGEGVSKRVVWSELGNFGGGGG